MKKCIVCGNEIKNPKNKNTILCGNPECIKARKRDLQQRRRIIQNMSWEAIAKGKNEDSIFDEHGNIKEYYLKRKISDDHVYPSVASCMNASTVQ